LTTRTGVTLGKQRQCLHPSGGAGSSCAAVSSSITGIRYDPQSDML
jgi:hypothetical protein